VKVVEQERVRTEWRDRLRVERDSIYLHDSVLIERRGDTVFRDRWHVMTKRFSIHDTVYISRVDSVPYTVYVEKPPNALRSFINKATASLLVILAIVAFFAICFKIWIRRL
jgi:hypothetical protein